MHLPQISLADVQALMAACGPLITEVDAVVQSSDGDEWAVQLTSDPTSRAARLDEILPPSSDQLVDWSKQRARKIVTSGHELTVEAATIEDDLAIVAYDAPAL